MRISLSFATLTFLVCCASSANADDATGGSAFEDPVALIVMLIVVVMTLGMIAMNFFLLKRFYKSVPPGSALLVTKTNGTRVVRNGGSVVLPAVHSSVLLDLSVQRVVVRRAGADGLQCRDGIRADCRAEFLVKVNATDEDILKVAQSVGAERASDPATLVELFEGKFADALGTVAANLEFEELIREREQFRDEVLQVVGQDLNGYALEDLAIASLEQTPVSALDPDNLKDAEGIRKITERTTRERLDATRLRLEAEEGVRRLEAEAAQAVAEANAQAASAEAEAKAAMEAASKAVAAEVALREAEAASAAHAVPVAAEDLAAGPMKPWDMET